MFDVYKLKKSLPGGKKSYLLCNQNFVQPALMPLLSFLAIVQTSNNSIDHLYYENHQFILILHHNKVITQHYNHVITQQRNQIIAQHHNKIIDQFYWKSNI